MSFLRSAAAGETSRPADTRSALDQTQAEGSRQQEDAPSRVGIGIVIGIALLAGAVRIPGAIRDSFWQDEVASAHVLIKSTPWGMLHQVARTEATPPLWYALGWITNQLGLPTAGYRAISVLAGAALAGATVMIAGRVLPRWGSAFAGILAAFGWQLVVHGHELRGYELFAFTTVAFVWVLLEARQAEPRPGWKGYRLAFVTAATSLTNYFFLLTLAGAIAWLWFDPELKISRRRLSRQIGLGLVPLLLWSPILIHQYLGQRFSWIGPFTPHGFVDAYWELFAPNLPSIGGILLPLALLVAVTAGCFLLTRESSEGRFLGAAAIAPVGLCGLAWLGGAHVFDPRNLVAAAPFAAVALAALASAAPRWLAFPVATAVTVAVAVGSIRAEAIPPTPYDKISLDLVARGWHPQDPILLFGTFGDFFAYRGPIEWYLPSQPTLTLGLPGHGHRCPRIYAIAKTRAMRLQLIRTGMVATGSTIDGIFVGRLRGSRVPTRRFWRRAHILVGREGRPACVRLVPETKLISVLRHT